jgi:hypothetical protein
MQNFVTPKVADFYEFRGISGSSVYYTEYSEYKKTYEIQYKRNSGNTL